MALTPEILDSAAKEEQQKQAVAIQEQIKTDSNILQTIGLGTQAATALAAQQANRAAEDKASSHKSDRKKKAESVAPASDKKTTKASKEQPKEKKKDDLILDFGSDVEELTPCQKISKLYKEHQSHVKGLVLASDEATRKKQAIILSGATYSLTKDEADRQEEIENAIEQEQQSFGAIQVDADLAPIETIVEEVKTKERQRIAAAMAINPAINATATARPVVVQYAAAVNRLERGVYAYSTQFVMQPQVQSYPRSQISDVLAAWLELQLLGSNQRLKTIITNNTYTPAFLNQLFGQNNNVSEEEKRIRALYNNPFGTSGSAPTHAPVLAPTVIGR